MQKSVSLYPFETNLLNLGYWYEITGDVKKAKDYYYKAINAAEAASSTDYVHDAANGSKIFIRLGWGLLHLEEYKDAEKIIK